MRAHQCTAPTDRLLALAHCVHLRHLEERETETCTDTSNSNLWARVTPKITAVTRLPSVKAKIRRPHLHNGASLADIMVTRAAGQRWLQR